MKTDYEDVCYHFLMGIYIWFVVGCCVYSCNNDTSRDIFMN